MFTKIKDAIASFKNRKTESLTTLENLKNGNQLFTSKILKTHSISNIERVKNLAENGQNPVAILVTCSDARISPERIFQGEMGDFFIIRTAGHVVGPLELGSIEYAITHSTCNLLIIMGHENCGAVKSCIADHEGTDLGHIKDILHEIKPSIDKAAEETNDQIELLEKAEDLNIYHTIEKIKSSKIIQEYIHSERKLSIIGAKYGIATGKVTFFEDTMTCPISYLGLKPEEYENY